MSELDPRSILLATGLLYIAMPVAVVLILFRRHPRMRVIVWALSGACMGVMALCYSVRGVAPNWLSIGLANMVGFAAFFLKLPVLRLEMGAPPRWGRALALWCAGTAPFMWAFLSGQSDLLRSSINSAVQACGAPIFKQAIERRSGFCNL